MSARRRRPTILDADEFDYLPETAYIPIEGGDTSRQQVHVRLRDMVRGGIALLVYSSRARLVTAYGGEQPMMMTVPARDLPDLQRRLGFNAILLDVAVPPELRSQPSQLDEPDERGPAPVFDGATGEPVIYVPSRPFRSGDAGARLELQPLANGHRALLAYSSPESLLNGCGPEQYYVRFRSSMLREAMRQCGADRVLIDAELPDHLRYRPQEKLW